MATQIPITAREELTLFGGRAPVALMPPPPTFPSRITEVAKQLSLLGSGSGPSSSSSLYPVAAPPLRPPPPPLRSLLRLMTPTNEPTAFFFCREAKTPESEVAPLLPSAPLHLYFTLTVPFFGCTFLFVHLYPRPTRMYSLFTWKASLFCRHRFPSPAYFLGNDRRQTDEAEDDGRTSGRAGTREGGRARTGKGRREGGAPCAP